jgi:hypothetical protein
VIHMILGKVSGVNSAKELLQICIGVFSAVLHSRVNIQSAHYFPHLI